MCEGSLDITMVSAPGSARRITLARTNALYQQFARRVSAGIRNRRDATGIYAHAMAVIVDAPDKDLLRGLSINHIFDVAHSRESRIQKGNLHTVLERIEGLQVDDAGRGLVIAYDEANREVFVVDRQLLLYRKYSTVAWPWDALVREARIEPTLGEETLS